MSISAFLQANGKSKAINKMTTNIYLLVSPFVRCSIDIQKRNLDKVECTVYRVIQDEKSDDLLVKFILYCLKEGQLCSWNFIKKEVYLFNKSASIVDPDHLSFERYSLGIWTVTQPHKDGCSIFPMFVRALRNRIEWYPKVTAFS
jgi:hypothetical protein